MKDDTLVNEAVRSILGTLRAGALVTLPEIRFYARLDGLDLDGADTDKAQLARVMDRYADRADECKRCPKDWTVWRVRA